MSITDPLHHFIDNGQTVATAVLLSVVGASGFLVLPLLIGAAAEQLSLKESQQGLLAFVLMAAAASSALLAIFLVRKYHWVKLAYAALLVMLAGDIAALIFKDSFSLFLVAVVAISLGGGIVYSLALTVLSDNSKPDRMFGYSIAAQVSFQVLGLLLLPAAIESGGLHNLILFFIVVTSCGIAVAWLLPASGLQHEVSKPFSVFTQPRVMYALTGCFFFFFNVGCFWAFIERMGNSYGYEAQTIGNSLAAGVSVGVIGALAASWQGERFGRFKPLLISSIGTVIAAVMLNFSRELAVYVFAVALYNFVWNYSLAYQYAVVATVDHSGRGIAIAPAFHAVGAAVGPGLAGLVISADNFLGVNVLVSLSVIISFVFFIPAVRGSIND